jgi:hypothetical protein
MTRESKATEAKFGAAGSASASLPVNATEADIADPRVVLSLLEADQVVAAKRDTRFGLRKFSTGVRLLLWGLRVYVILMLVIVLISVFRALQPAH